MNRLFVILAFGIGLSMPAPAGAQDYARDLQGIIDGYVRPAMTAFADASAKLPKATTLACSSPGAETRDAFRAAYGETVRAFGGISFLRFGALVEEDRLNRLAFLPDPRSIGERQVRKLLAGKDEAALTANSVAGKSVAVQGLTALQLIAFDKDGAVVLGTEAAADSYPCRYAAAIAGNVAAIGAELEREWSDTAGYSSVLLSAGPGNDRFHTPKEAVEMVFNTLVTGLIVVKDQDILPVLGSSPDKARPSRLPFSRSGNGLSYVRAELAGIRAAIQAFGVTQNLGDDFEWIPGSLEFEFRQADATLAELTPPIRKTFSETDAYSRFSLLTITVDSLRDTIALELAGALNLAGGFNALDGD